MIVKVKEIFMVKLEDKLSKESKKKINRMQIA